MPNLVAYSYDGVRSYRSDGSLNFQGELPSPFTFHEMLDAKRVVTPGGDDNDTAFTVTDLADGRTLFKGPRRGDISESLSKATVVFSPSPDGSMLAVGYSALAPKESVIVYDTADWHVLASFELPDESRPGIGLMQFSDDGSVLVVPLADNAIVANPRLSDKFKIFSSSLNYGYSLSPDGKLVAVLEAISADRDAIHIRRIEDGALLASHSPAWVGDDCADHIAECGVSLPILWSNDQRGLVFPDGWDTIRIWRPFSGDTADAIIHISYFAGGLAISPNGSQIAVADLHSVDLIHITAH
ncbi:hypothetical protein [Rhizobium sp. BK376]|uniref:WD40 repeat domain-containing protein n=1 Tax=Rhizobium sp. BK376 TaxID=2512149 RepID=UPI00104CBEE3|nr:hypothetical protein [Rhizobium sp. BK376]TCR80773.1 hypothetical protein EV561_11350 [Rhizobium sp. BK376]